MKMLHYVRARVSFSLGNKWMEFVNGKKCLALKMEGPIHKSLLYNLCKCLLRKCAESDCGHSPAAAYVLISRAQFKCLDLALLFIPSSARWNLIEYLTCFKKLQVSAYFSVISASLAKCLSLNKASGKQPLGNWIKICISTGLPRTQFQSYVMSSPRVRTICRPSGLGVGIIQGAYRLYSHHTWKQLSSVLTGISGSELYLITKLANFTDFN